MSVVEHNRVVEPIRSNPPGGADQTSTRRAKQPLLGLVIGTIPLTGLVLPGSFLVFDGVAAILVATTWRRVNIGRLQRPPWIFAAVILVLVAGHQLVPDTPANSGLVFARGAVSCLLVSLTLTVAAASGIGYDRVLRWFLYGTAATVAWAIAAEFAPALSELAVIRGDTGMSGRSIGLSRHSNLLGLHVAQAGIYLHGLRMPRHRKLALGLTVVVGLALAGSRAGVICLAAGLAFIAVTSRSGRDRRRAIAMGLASAAITGALVATTDQGRLLYDRMTGARGVTGDDERRELMDLGLRLARDHWQIGAPYDGRLFHSIYLTYSAILGVGGLIALIALIGWSGLVATTRARGRQRVDARAAIAAMAVVLVAHNAVAEPVLWLVLLAPTLLPPRARVNDAQQNGGVER